MTKYVGRQIDQYLVKSHIAQGGMADVYLATDVGLERAVALKVMLPELMERQDFAARFQREARTIASLHHPNIVQIYTTGTTPGGEPYLAMQYLLDGTLQTRLETLAQQQVTLQPAAALQLVQQVAKALVVAHRAGVPVPDGGCYR